MSAGAGVKQDKNYMMLIFKATSSDNEYAVCIKGILA